LGSDQKQKEVYDLMAMEESKTYIQTKDLELGYQSRKGKNILFSNLDLSIDGGQLICFMGSNGVGKSSLIRTLAGLQKPLAGWVVFPSKPPSTEIEKWIALVLTDKINTTTITVLDLVRFGRYPYLNWGIKLTEADHKIICDAVAATRIEHLVDTPIDELSDGQMQLALIARALAQDTPVILLDEPTAHLDLNNRVEIMRLLKTIARNMNKAILIATHELDLALQTADLLWLATQHKTIKSGVPEDLVLNGSLDEIFKLKGFDLKTGKVNQEPHRNIAINLVGEGHEFLWTKNALEREGYSISDNAEIKIDIIHEEKLAWRLVDRQKPLVVNSIEGLLHSLIKIK
jgi:iron complex transport system ATP-binding protein